MNNWVLLFAVPLAAYVAPYFSATFSAHYLLLPLAALLGKRYGLTGVIAVAVGGLAFVSSIDFRTWGSFGGNPALYLVGIAVAAIFASDRPLSDWLRWPGGATAANWVAFAAPFLLVFSVATMYAEPENRSGYRLALHFYAAPLGYFLLLMMGARGVRYWPPLLGLAAVGVLSWALNLAGLLTRPGFGTSVYAGFGPLQPSTALAALAAFATGAELGRVLQGRPAAGLWARPYLAASALLLAWAGPDALNSVPAKIGVVYSVTLFKASVLLPLTSLMLGLLRGGRGVVFAIAGMFTLSCSPRGSISQPRRGSAGTCAPWPTCQSKRRSSPGPMQCWVRASPRRVASR